MTHIWVLWVGKGRRKKTHVGEIFGGRDEGRQNWAMVITLSLRHFPCPSIVRSQFGPKAAVYQNEARPFCQITRRGLLQYWAVDHQTHADVAIGIGQSSHFAYFRGGNTKAVGKKPSVTRTAIIVLCGNVEGWDRQQCGKEPMRFRHHRVCFKFRETSLALQISEHLCWAA